MTANNDVNNENDDNEKVLPATKTPPKYQEASIRFREVWLQYVDTEELVKYEIVDMIKILEAEGYSRTQAIQKIVNDHNDLKGFSRRTIYRQLPDSMKRTYEDSTNMLPQYSDVSNDTFNKLQDKEENIVNITTKYDVKLDEIADDLKGQEEEEEEENAKDLPKLNYDDEVSDEINDDNLHSKKLIKKSSNDNPQDLTRQMNHIPNDMLPWYERKTTSENLAPDLPSDKIDHLIDWHLGVIIDNYRQLWIEINRMIRKLHEENPEWELDKIINTIFAHHEERAEYIPFNKVVIKKHLDTENKELFGIYKKYKPILDMKSIEDMR